MIPKHCIKIFRSKFTYYPTFIKLDPEYVNSDLNKFFSKSNEIWANESISGDGQRTVLERFLEYDSTGIMVYIKENEGIFILTTGDRKNVANFMISNLKRK